MKYGFFNQSLFFLSNCSYSKYHHIIKEVFSEEKNMQSHISLEGKATLQTYQYFAAQCN